MEETIQTFIDQKKIAVVGASRSGGKFGNAAAKELQDRGYEVLYIHPEAEKIEGVPTHPSLQAVKDQVECVFVCVPAERGEIVLRNAAAAGLTKVWIQQGADSHDLVKIGEDLGLDLVTGKCILMYAEPVRSFHKFHQLVWKLIGQF